LVVHTAHLDKLLLSILTNARTYSDLFFEYVFIEV